MNYPIYILLVVRYSNKKHFVEGRRYKRCCHNFVCTTSANVKSQLKGESHILFFNSITMPTHPPPLHLFHHWPSHICPSQCPPYPTTPSQCPPSSTPTPPRPSYPTPSSSCPSFPKPPPPCPSSSIPLLAWLWEAEGFW